MLEQVVCDFIEIVEAVQTHAQAVAELPSPLIVSWSSVAAHHNSSGITARYHRANIADGEQLRAYIGIVFEARLLAIPHYWRNVVLHVFTRPRAFVLLGLLDLPLLRLALAISTGTLRRSLLPIVGSISGAIRTLGRQVILKTVE